MMKNTIIAAALLLLLVNPTGDATAQIHAYGSCWIERDELSQTTLHSDADSLCTLDFPADCYGGMMSPDSLLCVLQDITDEMVPEGVVHAVHCEVEDDQGSSMMNGGHMMGSDFFRRPVELTVAYDPERVTSLGMNLEDLVLVIRVGDGFETVGESTHQMSSHSFSLSTTALADWYGIADATKVLVDSDAATWGEIKASFQR